MPQAEGVKHPLFTATQLTSQSMDQPIPGYLLRHLVSASAEIGATIALTQSGKIKPFLSKAQAFRKYGRRNVEHWLNDGLLTIIKDGNHSACWRIDRVELELIQKAIFLFQLL